MAATAPAATAGRWSGRVCLSFIDADGGTLPHILPASLVTAAGIAMTAVHSAMPVVAPSTAVDSSCDELVAA